MSEIRAKTEKQKVPPLRRAFKEHMSGCWLLLACGLCCFAISTPLALAIPAMLRRIIDTVFVRGESDSSGVDVEAGVLQSTVALCLLTFLARHLVAFVAHSTLNIAGEKAAANVRIRVLSHAQRLPLEQIDASRIAAAAQLGGSKLQDFLAHSCDHFISSTIYFLGGLIMIAVLNLRLGATAIVVMLPVAVLDRIMRKNRNRAAKSSHDASVGSRSMEEEVLRRSRVIKAFAAENEEDKFLEDVSRSRVGKTTRGYIVLHGATAITQFATNAALCFVVLVAGYESLKGRLSSGSLLSFVYYCSEIAKAGEKLLKNAQNVSLISVALEEAFDILDSPTEEFIEIETKKTFKIDGGDANNQTSRPGLRRRNAKPYRKDGTIVESTEEIESIGRYIQFVDVSFTYPIPKALKMQSLLSVANKESTIDAETYSTKSVLNEVSFDVERGSVVAIVGPSGSGKTTLLDLIPRFYKPTKGRILLNGRDTREMELKKLRGRIGWVPQMPRLLAGTIESNIQYGSPLVTHEDVCEAAEAAMAKEFIDQLPNKFQTMVTCDGGVSGGQAQRICIARALIRKPEILILDEPLASLDAQTEHKLLHSIYSFTKRYGSTVFMTVHRMATVRDADQILVLNQGHLVQQGTHSSLIATNGVYKTLCDLQAPV